MNYMTKRVNIHQWTSQHSWKGSKACHYSLPIVKIQHLIIVNSDQSALVSCIVERGHRLAIDR